MSPVHCPLCGKRISDWMMSAGKCTVIENHVVHIACLTDVTPSEAAAKIKDPGRFDRR